MAHGFSTLMKKDASTCRLCEHTEWAHINNANWICMLECSCECRKVSLIFRHSKKILIPYQILNTHTHFRQEKQHTNITMSRSILGDLIFGICDIYRHHTYHKWYWFYWIATKMFIQCKKKIHSIFLFIVVNSFSVLSSSIFWSTHLYQINTHLRIKKNQTNFFSSLWLNLNEM